MIVTRTPLRISFAGGGSDLPWFYREEPGAVVSAAIDKYVYVAVNAQFEGRVLAHYRATEDVATVAELRHDRMRESLLKHRIDRGIEITSMADVPGSTGLGSSSAFTVGLLHALAVYQGRYTDPAILAAAACEMEITRCRAPIGKQDQYVAAYGGLYLYRFQPDGWVELEEVRYDPNALSDHLLLLYTGAARQGDAGQQIARQRQGREDVRELARLAPVFAYELERGALRRCGEVMQDAWQIKRRFVNDTQIEQWYNRALQAGAWGGKLCGAGGGGFLAFLAPPEAHDGIVRATGLRRVPVRLGVAGSEVVWAAH